MPFKAPNTLTVFDVIGVPKNGEIVELYKGNTTQSANVNIGSARAYGFNLKDAAYENDTTKWDLHLYDIQTRTDLILNRTITPNDIPVSSFIVGKSSGAVGFSAEAPATFSTLKLTQTSGKFIRGEQLEVNGVDFPVGVGTVNTFGINDIKSVRQAGVTDFPTFFGRTVLQKAPLPNNVTDIILSNSGIATATNAADGGFLGLKNHDTIIYDNPEYDEQVYNRIDSVSDTGKNATLFAIAAGAGVTNVFTGQLPTAPSATAPIFKAFLGIPVIRTNDTGLVAPLPDQNISSLGLDRSNILINEQLTGEQVTGNDLVINTSQLSGITSAAWAPFDEERYSIFYPDAVAKGAGNLSIGKINNDTFTLAGNQITISGLSNHGSDIVVNTTVQKNFIKSKLKTYNRSQKLIVNKSKNATSR